MMVFNCNFSLTKITDTMEQVLKKISLYFLLYGLLMLCLSSISNGQVLSKYIVVDQFGYRPESKKVAVIRDPQTGFDAAESFTPGQTYAVVNMQTGNQSALAAPVQWKTGATDASSGDRAWWYDFSSVTAPGTYYVLDVDKNLKSFDFKIADDIYTDVLKHAVRTFFYQRVGFEKSASHATAAWADGASHMRNLQDKNARQYNKSTDVTTEVDVSGGWYDAGDYNKYTNWTANYVVDFMRAYLENPGAWGDDYNIPESGNKIPDILDEAKWGIDHLLRMQKTDGSVLSIVGLSHASPPSSATGPSLYGTPNTSGTLNTSAALALASKVYGSRGMTEYADKLKTSAIKAWDWAVANPNVIFKNNDVASGTSGLGAGQQETDAYGKLMAKLEASCFLFEITGETKYREYFDANYDDVHLFAWTYVTPFETSTNEILLHYTTVQNATASVVNIIKSKYLETLNGNEIFPAVDNQLDPYRAYLKTDDYTWGSNSTKSAKGLIYTDMIFYGISAAKNTDAKIAAEDFVHYLHGVNPLNLVYLSNMYAYGADNGVNEFYHSWFSNGSTKWDRTGTSTYGPAPGFVTGGPNPSYDFDACCATNSCGGSNAICTSENLAPPKGQPVQKSYKDFNTSWPLNSWSVTENSNGYQLNYIRLLSKFVTATYDCSGTLNGGASYDVCGRCSGGTTGITAIVNATECLDCSGKKNGTASVDACEVCSGGTTGIKPITDANHCDGTVTGTEAEYLSVDVFPNPTTGAIVITTKSQAVYTVKIINAMGSEILTENHTGDCTLAIDDQPAGVYVIIVRQLSGERVRKLIKF
jgi:hypothetical protein